MAARRGRGAVAVAALRADGAATGVRSGSSHERPRCSRRRPGQRREGGRWAREKGEQPFAEYMWMENQEDFDRQVEEELQEQEFLDRCFQEMLDEEDQEWFVPSRDLPQRVGQLQQQLNGLCVADGRGPRGCRGGQLLANPLSNHWPTIDQHMVNHWPTIDQHMVNHWPTIDQHVVKSWPIH
ncbi:LOW QUALITY PROTEIN: polyadenylate-binding protein-interacting protein 2B [Lagopus muta]|uniref:LOW QUALITY PROTEIN: polyadenylate-binding protein-interacting protein 2B n=1 Tax=Lagopus muta TaxID=64668 RepID=UPI00209EE416|nr:LOW QUALITY PROTEIN: polyadenylate-binding protein-interacting protein 2B [Lagopus muta]